MDSNDKLWLGFWFCFGMTIIGVAWAIAYGRTAVELEAIRAGLRQVEYIKSQSTGLKWAPK